MLKYRRLLSFSLVLLLQAQWMDSLAVRNASESLSFAQLLSTTAATTNTIVGNDTNKRMTRLPIQYKYGSYHISIDYYGAILNLIIDTGSRITTWNHPQCQYRQHRSNDKSNASLSNIEKQRLQEKQRQLLQNRIIPTCPNNCQLIHDSRCFIDENKTKRRRQQQREKLHRFQQQILLLEKENSSYNITNYCMIEQRYTEGSSWSGYEVYDTITLVLPQHHKGDLDYYSSKEATTTAILNSTTSISFPIIFACQISVSGLFQEEQYSHGILGLRPYGTSTSSSNGSTATSTFLQSLYDHLIISSTSFSLCLSRRNGGGGYIGFGGPLSELHAISSDNNNNTNEVQQQQSGSTTLMQYTPIMSMMQRKQIPQDSRRSLKGTVRQYKSKKNDSNKNKNGSNKLYSYNVYVEEVWIGTICLTCDTAIDEQSNEEEIVTTKSYQPITNKQQQQTKNSILQSFNHGKGTIFDSGTTDTYFPKSVLNRFQQVWYRLTGRRWWRSASSSQNDRRNSNESKYMALTAIEFQQLPSILFVLSNNVTFIIPPMNYLESVNDDDDIVDYDNNIFNMSNSSNNKCSNDVIESCKKQQQRQDDGGKNDKILQLTNRIYFTESTGAVLGSNAMIGYDIFFDTDNYRIGIAHADCDAQL